MPSRVWPEGLEMASVQGPSPTWTRVGIAKSSRLTVCVFFVLFQWLEASEVTLRFNDEGTFKILQIADMHYGNGRTTGCNDVRPEEIPFCSDLNTTAFVRHLIEQEEPDLIIFTGDNIDWSASDAKTSMDEAFAPAIEAKIPWAAVLGNHDVESNMNRSQLIEYITQMSFSLAKVQDPDVEGTHGWGNYYLQVLGPLESGKESTSLLNLYFLDSGDNSKLPEVPGYDWIRASQINWFASISQRLRVQANDLQVPGLAYFHIPLPEYDAVIYHGDIVGVQQEDVYSPPVNSGFFSTLLEEGDVKATFVGHDHVNDYCGKLMGINLCYGGGIGYHAYGKVGWSRRARIVVASLDKDAMGQFADNPNITTWKRLDDSQFSQQDMQLLYSKSTDTFSKAARVAYHKGCSCPWRTSMSEHRSCYYRSAFMYTGVLLFLTAVAFLCRSFVAIYRSTYRRLAAYEPAKSEAKVEG